MAEKKLSWDGLYLIIEVGGYENYFHQSDYKQASKLELTVQYLTGDILSVYHGVPH